MNKILNFCKKGIKGLGNALTGRDENIYRVWYIILVAIIILVAVAVFVVLRVIREPSEKELFLLVENEQAVVLNRGLLDEVLDFYDQKGAEFQAVKNEVVKVADPSR